MCRQPAVIVSSSLAVIDTKLGYHVITKHDVLPQGTSANLNNGSSSSSSSKQPIISQHSVFNQH
jgi:hypothetical protein